MSKSEIKYTTDQQHGIEDEQQDLLLSASAGSGKTAVLVERVLRKLLNPSDTENRLELKNLLIVTFTEAAAEGMKEKIKKRLEAALETETNPSQRDFLKKQLRELPLANISTIHAFCLEIIKRFYYYVDLDPSFSLLTDDIQLELLKEQALEQVFQQHFEADDQLFLTVLNNFSGSKSINGLQDLILDLYRTVISQPKPKQQLKNLANIYQDFTDGITNASTFKKQLQPLLLLQVGQIEDLLAQTARLDLDRAEYQNAASVFTSMTTQLQQFRQDLRSGATYDQLRQDLSAIKLDFQTDSRKIKPLEASATKEEKAELAAYHREYLKPLFLQANELLTQLKTAFFANEEADELALLQQSQQYTTKIIELTSEFLTAFANSKRRQNFLDFNDLEQFAAQILTSDETTSNLALDYYQHKFKEIMIDEYQDTNDIQEQIMQAIKNPSLNQLFMVGDVKQSIYGFREANPQLFLEKYRNFADADPENELINLQANFRSNAKVLNFVNRIFNELMDQDFGDISYRQNHQLVFGAKEMYQAPAANSVELAVINDAPPVEQDKPVLISEIDAVIKRIQVMLAEGYKIWDFDEDNNWHERPLKLSDIAILTRVKSQNFKILEAFEQAGLAVNATDAVNYFQTMELSIILAMLTIIDNPHQDIPLVGVMRSPLYNFSESDFAKIRIFSKRQNFYQAVVNYAAKNTDDLSQQLQKFLDKVNTYRTYQKDHRISELIWFIYQDTRLLDIMQSLPNGRQRRINLQALYERAQSYETAGFKGLYQFIHFINRMRQKEKDLAQPLLLDESSDAVNLMTIHKSKGLEFPVVFLIDTAHKFNLNDVKKPYAIDKELGLSFDLKDEFIKQSTILKTASKIKLQKKQLEEEARLLYVALTRAKQKLIIVLDQKKITPKKMTEPQPLTTIAKLGANNFADFLIPTLRYDDEVSINELTNELQTKDDVLKVSYNAMDLEANKTTAQPEMTTTTDLDATKIKQVFAKLYHFDYRYPENTKTTAYQAVSEIKQVFADPVMSELENAKVEQGANRYLQPLDQKPSFLTTTAFTGAEKGTAIHLILQKHDFSKKFTPEQVKAEISQLISQNLLTPELVAELDLTKLFEFLSSDFSQTITQNVKSLKREQSFSSLVKARAIFKDFTDPTSDILVHGTIDGYFKTPAGLVLFDYKTDQVKGDVAQARQQLIENYQGQLNFYAKALTEITGEPIVAKYLIPLELGELIELTNETQGE